MIFIILSGTLNLSEQINIECVMTEVWVVNSITLAIQILLQHFHTTTRHFKLAFTKYKESFIVVTPVVHVR